MRWPCSTRIVTPKVSNCSSGGNLQGWSSLSGLKMISTAHLQHSKAHAQGHPRKMMPSAGIRLPRQPPHRIQVNLIEVLNKVPRVRHPFTLLPDASGPPNRNQTSRGCKLRSTNPRWRMISGASHLPPRAPGLITRVFPISPSRRLVLMTIE